MKCLRPLLAALAFLSLSACGAVSPIRTASLEPAASCAALGWDRCAIAPNCRHGRDFSADQTERFVCQARYQPAAALPLSTASR